MFKIFKTKDYLCNIYKILWEEMHNIGINIAG